MTDTALHCTRLIMLSRTILYYTILCYAILGVDDLHCFFVNDDGLTVPRSSVSNPTYDLSYRKVIQYVAYIDGVDTVSGHGTHVCGTIAGDISDVVTDFRGHAPGAKIAFFDMASDENGIYYPSLYDKVFPIAYQAGARLHSNSW